MEDYTKADWKLFRERITGWQENYMERLAKEYVELLTKAGNASDKFWELEERINQDKKHPGVGLELRKSNMVYDLAYLLRTGVICEADLEGFSKDTREAVEHFL